MRMRQLTLTEYLPERRVPLSLAQRDQLAALPTSIAMSPTIGTTDVYDLTPGSWVGSIHLDDLDVVVLPKVDIDRLLFMMSYSLERIRDLESPVGLAEADELPEAIVMAFIRLTRRALARGVQQGYRTIDDSSLTVRGRLRVGDQIRSWYGSGPPAEISYDDFSVDIELNRILLAATSRLARMRFRNERSRAGLRGIEARLDGVSLVPYNPRRLPEVVFTRLNGRYEAAVRLARLILRSASFDLGHGRAPATAFLVDMNRVFEDFVIAALRDALGPDVGRVLQGARGRSLHLDEADEISLEPDLTIWRGNQCVFVGDVKYKRIVSNDFPNADIYQATAYAIASGLDRALLIYAASEGEPASHRIVRIGVTIDVVALDISVPPAQMLMQIGNLAEIVRSQVSLSGMAVE